MKDINEFMRAVTPDELASYLNDKGATTDTFKCPICHSINSTLIDSMPLNTSMGEVNIEGVGKAIMQPTLPTMLHPTIAEFQALIAEGKVPPTFHFLGEHLSHMSASNNAFLPVIHIVCDNCGHIRSFRKKNILDWLSRKGK